MNVYKPVKYQEYRPAPQLEPFLDCYWTSWASHSQKACVRRIMPDICADIILNLGEEVLVWNGQNHLMKPGKAYLVGTMTTFQDTVLPPGAKLVGIRFKPFGLGALLGIHLQGVTNQIEELDRKTFSLDYGYCHALGTPAGHAKAMERLDAYFLRRVSGQDISQMNHLIGTILDVPHYR
jgi:hypothetical protein